MSYNATCEKVMHTHSIYIYIKVISPLATYTVYSISMVYSISDVYSISEEYTYVEVVLPCCPHRPVSGSVGADYPDSQSLSAW